MNVQIHSSTPLGQQDRPVRDAMLSCALRGSLWIAAAGAVAALMYALWYAFDHAGPKIAGVTSTLWYGWAAIITRGYTDFRPALVTIWVSVPVAAWCFCVAAALTGQRGGARFSVAGHALLLLGALPANCALCAVLEDHRQHWHHPPLEIAAIVTAPGVALGIVIYFVVVAFAVADTIHKSDDKRRAPVTAA